MHAPCMVVFRIFAFDIVESFPSHDYALSTYASSANYSDGDATLLFWMFAYCISRRG